MMDKHRNYGGLLSWIKQLFIYMEKEEMLKNILTTYFSIKAFILDPTYCGDTPIQPTSFESECLTDNPLKDIVKVVLNKLPQKTMYS